VEHEYFIVNESLLVILSTMREHRTIVCHNRFFNECEDSPPVLSNKLPGILYCKCFCATLKPTVNKGTATFGLRRGCGLNLVFKIVHFHCTGIASQRQLTLELSGNTKLSEGLLLAYSASHNTIIAEKFVPYTRHFKPIASGNA
jgi:hypothetical protein